MAAEQCGQEVGENTVYWPCGLPKGHNGPHSWHPRRELWETEQRQVTELFNAVVVPPGGTVVLHAKAHVPLAVLERMRDALAEAELQCKVIMVADDFGVTVQAAG